jgi:hypothetical protein
MKNSVAMIWTFKGKSVKSVDDMPKDVIGFVYRIINIKSGKFYIGKKSVVSRRKLRISKREKEKTKTRKTFKIQIKESNWKGYTGSSKELNEDIKKLGEKAFIKQIVEYCFNKKYLNFAEFSYQIKEDVLKVDSYNGNILGRFYRKDMENKKLKTKT